MTEIIPTRPFEDGEAIAWLRSQPDGRVTASAAELARQWGWNRMRAGRQLKAWQKTGHIRRNAEEIIVTTPVTPTVTETPGATITRRSKDIRQARRIRRRAGACLRIVGLFHRRPHRNLCRCALARDHDGRYAGSWEACRRGVAGGELALGAEPSASDLGRNDW